MWFRLIFYNALFQFFGVHNAPTIPDEVFTLQYLIVNYIPKLKKGTDSRIGWGFRLGDRADFQVVLELGPQKYTQLLANPGRNTEPIQ